MSSLKGKFLFRVLLAKLFGKKPKLVDLANLYERELTQKVFHYTFSQKARRSFRADLVFEKANFCHLMSIASLVDHDTKDLDEYSGIKGWRNIQEGKITMRLLKAINPNDFAYYQKEYEMFVQLVEMLHHPQAVLFDPKKVKNTKLKSKIILYGVYGQHTIHLGIDQDRDSDWFARSYFVRENDKNDQYPSKYVANMTPLAVKVKVSSKKA